MKTDLAMLLQSKKQFNELAAMKRDLLCLGDGANDMLTTLTGYALTEIERKAYVLMRKIVTEEESHVVGSADGPGPIVALRGDTQFYFQEDLA